MHEIPSDYTAWLATHTGLAGRTLRDVVSRTRRVVGLVDLTNVRSEAEVDFRLSESTAFLSCSPSVQSQLRRAAKLYSQYLNRNPA